MAGWPIRSPKKPKPKPKPGYDYSHGFLEPPGGNAVNILTKGNSPASSDTLLHGKRNWRKTQEFLRKQGYDIPITGRADKVTISAINDWQSGVKTRNPSQWNVSNARSKALNVDKAHPLPSGTTPRPGPLPKTGTGKTKAKPTRKTAGTSTGFLQASPLGVNVPFVSPISTAQANTGAKLLDTDLAGKMAGLEFDPQIFDAGTELARLGPQGAQNERDIGNWYNQAIGHQAAAANRSAEATRQGQQSFAGLTQGILSSLGGAANPAASGVAAAGASELGTLGALGAVNDQYNADVAPIFASERAGQMTGERARTTAARQDLVRNIASLRGQRGQAEAGQRLNIQNMNNQILDNRAARGLDIKKYNDSLIQQAFGNQMGLSQQDFQNTLALNELNVAAAMADAKISNLKAQSKPANGAGFRNATPDVKNQVWAGALGAIGSYDPERQAFVDANGQIKPRMNTITAVQTVNSFIRSMGWSLKNPAVLAFRNNILMGAGIKPDPRWK